MDEANNWDLIKGSKGVCPGRMWFAMRTDMAAKFKLLERLRTTTHFTLDTI